MAFWAMLLELINQSRYKDGKNFTDVLSGTSYNPITFSDDNSKITFEYITVGDSGDYKCIAKNRIGSIVGTIKLDVQETIHFPPFVIAIIVAGKGSLISKMI